MQINLFRVELIKFPLNTSNNCTKIQGLKVKIFPFHRHNYVLYVNGSLEKSNINCTCKTFLKYLSSTNNLGMLLNKYFKQCKC